MNERKYFEDRDRSKFGLKMEIGVQDFFHSKAYGRRRNHVHGLMDDGKNWITSQSEIQDLSLNFYKRLFTSGDTLGLEELTTKCGCSGY